MDDRIAELEEENKKLRERVAELERENLELRRRLDQESNFPELDDDNPFSRNYHYGD